MKATVQRISDALCDATIAFIVWQADRERAVKAGQPVKPLSEYGMDRLRSLALIGRNQYVNRSKS